MVSESPDATFEGLQASSSFDREGTVTAEQRFRVSMTVRGAIILASESAVSKYGLTPLVELTS